MFSNFEKDKEIFTASANVCEAMENDDETKTSALISGILASRKNKNKTTTTKKYKRQLALAEKFEAMTREERQAYLDDLEDKITDYSKKSAEFDRKFKSQDDLDIAVEALKAGAGLGAYSAVLGMATFQRRPISSAIVYGGIGAIVGIQGNLCKQAITAYVTKRKIKEFTEEWVACSIAENTSEMER